MTVHDRIRLTGLLRKGPAPAGPFYAAARDATPPAYAAVVVFGRERGKAPSVVVDDRGVQVVRPDGTTESVAWQALAEVRVMTTSQGPLADDVFFVLDGGDRGCVIPQRLMPDELLIRLQALPNFDNGRLIEAMASTRDAEFLCWRRAAV